MLSSRCGGYLIDAVLAAIVSFAFTFLPVAGNILSGLFLLAWWLLRDINGASPGKLLLGLKVVARDGSAAGLRERILRNITLIAGPVFVLIPVAGAFTGPVVAISMTLLEIGFLFTRDQRIGDLLAGTTVVPK